MAKYTIYMDEEFPVYGVCDEVDPERCIELPADLVTEMGRVKAGYDACKARLAELYEQQEAAFKDMVQ